MAGYPQAHLPVTSFSYLPRPLCSSDHCRYSESEVEAKIAAILTPEGFQETTESTSSSAVGLVLDRTPFYAEQGGQVADIGRIASTSGIEYLEVQDTQVKPNISFPSQSFLITLTFSLLQQ